MQTKLALNIKIVLNDFIEKKCNLDDDILVSKRSVLWRRDRQVSVIVCVDDSLSALSR